MGTEPNTINAMERKLSLFSIYSLLIFLMMGMVSCEKDVAEEIIGASGNDDAAKNSLLQVRTRSGGGEEATVSYPVQVYVFQGEECKAVQTIGDAGQTLNIALVEGTYSIYAIGGASSNDYTLPTKEDATSTTALTLKEGKSLSDLMAASAVATLVDGGTNTVTLGMVRKTMMVQDVTIKKIPTAATAVSVTIAPLWQSLTVGGTYSTTNGSTTIALTKQSDNRTWQNAQPLPSLQGEGLGVGSVYLLPPSSQPASVSVNITIGGVTKTYTYSCSDQLEAGYKINIDGTYTEAVGVSLTGTITGATWLGERTISFTFDESGSTAAENNTDPTPDPSPTGAGSFPAVGDSYEGCYVLAVSPIDENSAELTLLSPNEGTAQGTDASVNSALATLGAASVSGWGVPTKAQMQLVEAKLLADDATIAGEKYLYRKSNDGLGYRSLGADESAWPTASATGSYRLRPVAVVSVTKE